MLPTGLLDFAVGFDPSLETKRLADVLSLALSNTSIPAHRQHKHRSDCFYLPHAETRKQLGNDYQQLLAKTDLIRIVGDYSRADSATYPYQVTDKFRELVLSFAESIESKSWVMELPEKAPVKRVKSKAIASRDSRLGNSLRATKCQVPAFTPINADILRRLPAAMSEWACHARESKAVRMQRYGSLTKPTNLITEALNFAARIVRPKGDSSQVGLVQTYTESAAGRLYANGWSLQNAPKALRKIIFSGHTEWDFEACHPAILVGKAQQYGMTVAALDFYVSYRAPMRRRLAEETGVPVSAVKTSFTALMYGARMTPYQHGSLFRTLGSEGFDTLTRHPLFRAIADEVTAVRQRLIEEFKRKNGVANPLGKICPHEKFRNQNSVAAHIIQGYEALMLDTVITALADDDGISRRAVLLQHDGWTTKEPSLEELAGALDTIEKKTGIVVSVDHERLDLSMGRNHRWQI